MELLKGVVLIAVVAAAIAVPSALAAPPANDDFAAATVLAGRSAYVAVSNTDATKQVDEPDHAGNAGGASVWFRWTAPDAGKATISTCDTDFDTLLDEVDANDDACGKQSRVSFETVAGETYQIAVDGAGGAHGSGWLSLWLAPLNDDFADAQGLAGDSGSVNGSTIGATSEDSEADHLGIGWNSVWYEWTAPSSGWAWFESCTSPFDSVLAVYTGSSLGELTRVAGNDDACGRASRVHFRASQGTTYRIALSGFEGETGDFTLTWNRNLPPPIELQAPAISGNAIDGETLTASTGEWDGEGPATFAFAWGRCDSDFESCGLIEGATSQAFTIRNEDVGFHLYVRVTATNAVGSTEAFSIATPVVQRRAPSNTIRPEVTGVARPGRMLVASGGAWVGTAPLSMSYQWQSCDASVTNCTALEGQTGQVMQVPASVLGRRIRVVVTATNVVGSASAASDATAVVRRTAPPRCVVPSVRGRTLGAARTAIKRGRCKVGRVRMIFSNRVATGRVVSQTPRGGRRLAVGTRVHLVVSKGKRR